MAMTDLLLPQRDVSTSHDLLQIHPRQEKTIFRHSVSDIGVFRVGKFCNDVLAELFVCGLPYYRQKWSQDNNQAG